MSDTLKKYISKSTNLGGNNGLGLRHSVWLRGFGVINRGDDAGHHTALGGGGGGSGGGCGGGVVGAGGVGLVVNQDVANALQCWGKCGEIFLLKL